MAIKLDKYNFVSQTRVTYAKNNMCMKEGIDILTLLEHCPGAMLTLNASDLGSFARKLIAESRREFERERAEASMDKVENFLSAETVMSVLKISPSTLYRMGKAKILCPVWVGGQKRYRQSDLEKIIERNS